MLGMHAGQARPARLDFVIVLTVVILTCVGLVFVYSASFALGLHDFGDVNFFIYRQVMGATAGAVAMFVLARLNYRRLAGLSPLIMLATVIGLVLVLVPGVGWGANGAERWIQLGPLPPVQPSEFAKLAMVIYIAAWLTAKGGYIRTFWLGVVPFILLVGMIGGLIMLQPDMGTFIVIVATTGIMFFVAGAALSHVLALGAATIAGGFFLIMVEGYRAQRFLAFLNAENDPRGDGFQILQLLIALGSGGMRGIGLGESRQKFFYIPGAHTDGIFAIVGEEIGFIGAVAVLVLFGTLIYRGFRVAYKSRDDFGYLLGVGITTWIALQTIVNIAGVTRSAPLTGIPLPFLSYGNSALVVTLAAVGVLLSISRYSKDEAFLERRTRPSVPLPPSRRSTRAKGDT